MCLFRMCLLRSKDDGLMKDFTLLSVLMIIESEYGPENVLPLTGETRGWICLMMFGFLLSS